jgi:hypothetical protein
MSRTRVSPGVLVLLLAVGAGPLVLRAAAQSISPSLSDSVAADPTDSGFDTNFGNGAGTIGQTFHEDVTDATHSDVFATSMSPVLAGTAPSSMDDAFSDSYGQRADALQLSDSNTGASRGGNNSAFRSSAFGVAEDKGADGFGVGSQSPAFRPTMMSGSMLHGGGATDGATAASGGSEPGSEPGSLIGRRGSAMSSNADTANQMTDVDPVLLPVSQGTEVLGGDILDAETPATEASGFFSSPETLRQTQFDDGVTPVLVSPRTPGTMVSVEAAYSHAENGFPDSTQGTAESPLDTAEVHAPHGLTTKSVDSLAPDSDGNLFAVKTGLAPNLFASSSASTAATARARAAIERQFEQSVINGSDLAEAEAQRRQALQALRSRSSRRSTLDQRLQDMSGRGFPQPSVSDTVKSSDLP